MKFDIGKQFIIAGIVGVLFVITLIVIAFTVECPTEFQNQIFKIVMALASGAFAVMIPGAININYKGVISASGAIAVFVMVYFFSPQTPLDTSSCNKKVHVRGMVSLSGKPAKDLDIFIQETDQLIHTNKKGKFTVNLASSKLPNKLTLYCENVDLGVDTIVYVQAHELASLVRIDLKEEESTPEISYTGNIYVDGNPLDSAMVMLPQLRTEVFTDKFGSFSIVPIDRISDRPVKVIISHEMERINEFIDMPERDLIASADIDVTPFEDTTQGSSRIKIINPVVPILAVSSSRPVVNESSQPMVKSSTGGGDFSSPPKADHCLVCMQFDADGKSRNIREKCNSDLKYLKDYIDGYARASGEQGLKYTCKFRKGGDD